MLLAADYLQALQSLMPRGRVWPKDPASTQWRALSGLTPTYERQTVRANFLLSDAFPVTPFELLPDWESSLGLPDPCAGLSPTIQARQQQVAARFIAGGGQSTGFFISLAATLGYVLTITQFTSSHFGQPFGNPFCNTTWDHVWQVNAPTFTVQHFTFGQSGMGEFFSSFGNTVLQCEIQRLAPAQSTVLFSYS